MSEPRLPDIVWTYRTPIKAGRKPLKIELFQAMQWKYSWNPYSKKKMYPKPPLRDRSYWEQYYRLRVDGRWYGRKGYTFTFYTMVQALEIAERLFREMKL